MIARVAVAQLLLCRAVKELFEGCFRMVNRKLDVAVVGQYDGYGDCAVVGHVVA